MSKATVSGIHHVALNVRDLDASVRWYQDVLDFSPLFPWNTDDFERRIMRHPGGVVIALTKHRHPDADAEFGERRTGLDHLAFTVQTRAELEAWAARLTDAGVVHSGKTISRASPPTYVSCMASGKGAAVLQIHRRGCCCFQGRLHPPPQVVP